MRARGEIRVELRGGVSTVVTLAGQPPLLARSATPRGAVAVVNLVTGAGGPCAGDELDLLITVGPGAALDVRSVGATVALPGRPGARESVLRTTIEVAGGARLRFLPEPVVAAAGCIHRMQTSVSLAEDSTVLLREELVRGRSGEDPGGRLTARLRVERSSRPVLDQELSLGTDPLVARTVGTLLRVAPAADLAAGWDAGYAALVGAEGALTALAEPNAYVVTAFAPDTVTLRRVLDSPALGEPARASAMSPGRAADQ